MKNRVVFIFTVLTLAYYSLHSQTKPSAFVDEKGALRWTEDNREVCFADGE